MKKNSLTNAEIESLLFYAFRYTLGRKTYAVNDVATLLIKCSPILHSNTKNKILEEIQKAIRDGEAGQKCDVSDWESVMEVFIND